MATFSIIKAPAYILLLSVTTILFLSSFYSEKSYLKPSLKEISHLDSLRDSIEVIDTIATYNPDDYSEKIVIVKRKIPRIAPKENAGFNIDDIVFSGKTMTKMDTFSTYNPTTKQETLMITSYDMPVELEEPMKGMNAREANKLKIKYATNKKTETKIIKRKK
jgi:hypothetical protein